MGLSSFSNRVVTSVILKDTPQSFSTYGAPYVPSQLAVQPKPAFLTVEESLSGPSSLLPSSINEKYEENLVGFAFAANVVLDEKRNSTYNSISKYLCSKDVFVPEDGAPYSNFTLFGQSDIPNDKLFSFEFPKASKYIKQLINGSFYDWKATNSFLQLMTLPDKGRIYYKNGTEIVRVPSLLDTTIRFRPLKDEYSGNSTVYTTLLYYAVDSLNGVQSAIMEIRIYVTGTDDPPHANPLIVEVIDKVDNLICLSGTDGDEKYGDRIYNGMIVTEPIHGMLYRFIGTSHLGSRIKAKEFLGMDTSCLYYIYTGGSKPNQNNLIDVDDFVFQVIDSTGLYSNMETASIKIRSPYTVGGEYQSHTTREDVDLNITLFVRDEGTTQYPLSFIISHPPSYGQLVDLYTGAILTNGSRVFSNSYPNHSDGVVILYRPLANYFNSPNTTYHGELIYNNDNFSYYAVLWKDQEYRTPSVTQELVVVGIGDLLRSKANYPTYHLNRVTEYAKFDDFGPSNNDRVYISGIEVIDLDRGVNLIRVSLTSTYGVVSVVPAYRTAVDFNSRLICFGHELWQCMGNGINDEEMTFVATPEVAELALNGLRYQSKAHNVTDTLYISLHYGYDEECVGKKHMRTEAEFKGCFITDYSVSIEINGDYKVVVNPLAKSLNLGTATAVKTRGVPMYFIVIGSLLLLAVALKLIYAYCFKKMSRDLMQDEKIDRAEKSNENKSHPQKNQLSTIVVSESNILDNSTGHA